jgi:integral membrane protein
MISAYPEFWQWVAALLHILTGFLALATAVIPWFLRKGRAQHAWFGRVFAVSMIGSSITAFPLAALHQNIGQAILGWTGLALVAGGWQVVAHQCIRWRFAAVTAQIVSLILLLVGIAWPALVNADLKLILVFFALIQVGMVTLSGLAPRFPRHSLQIWSHAGLFFAAGALAYGSFFNTQWARLTGWALPTEVKMLLPFLIAPLAGLAVFQHLADPNVTTNEPPFTARLRRLSVAEGISLLLLFGVAVPLKRIWGYGALVSWIGPTHGTLSLLFVVTAIQWVRHEKKGWRAGAGLVLSSVIPFGWFWADKILSDPR